ncbi:MFS transporter [Alteromonas aestuariivivens]|uniref:MFS transporter n=1 Tax=Alteromonas aestuariivivens TaxID=1938339 RepID=A0A3D8M6G2_9ALTE|nr:MFS transporter [Alteromonas aestuariivivens]RDV25160.1 MFS transporter [Alteromonas aestuariivivens]
MGRLSRTNLMLLALTYWLYFGQLGVLVPYLGIFLDGRGFSSAEIGELFAVITLARIIGPSLWAGIADKTGQALRILKFGCLLTVVCFSSVFYFHGFWGLTLSFGLMMMFWTAVLPQLEVITMQSVAGSNVSYGQIRLWGSIGFIVLTIFVGKLLDVASSEAPIYVSITVLSALFVSTLFLSSPVSVHRSDTSDTRIWLYLLTPVFIVFLLSAALLQVSFGAYYGFFALYMRDLSYTGQQTGLLIALGVLAEIGIFLVARRLIGRFGVRLLLLVCMLITAFRWHLLAEYAHLFWVVFVSQLFHALSFGLTHATSVHFIHHFLPASFHSRGQAIYISLAFGAGGAVGNYLAGQLWQQGEKAALTFNVAAACALAGALVLMLIGAKKMDARPA